MTALATAVETFETIHAVVTVVCCLGIVAALVWGFATGEWW